MSATDDYEAQYDEPRPDNPIARPTRYAITCLPDTIPDADMWTLTVEARADGLWAVKHHGATLGRDGIWDYDGIPETGRDAWRAAHYFPLGEALELAKAAALRFVRGGMTPADVLAWHAAGCPTPIPRPHLRARAGDTEASTA